MRRPDDAVRARLSVPQTDNLFDCEHGSNDTGVTSSPGKSSFLTHCRFRNGY